MSQLKKVAIIGAVGLPANYGGFETLTEQLVGNLHKDYDFTVYCSKQRYPRDERHKVYKGARLIYVSFNANGAQSIFYDSISLLHALFYADILLILGVAGAWMLPFIKFFTKKKIIISIDGIEWKRDKWSKLAKWYLKWAESMAVKHSHIDISDNEGIRDYTASTYGTVSRMVEYGADHTLKVLPQPEDLEEFSFLAELYAVKVCRIEPENNISIVLEAFSNMPNYKLVIIGNWNNSEYGMDLRNLYGGYPNIYLLDPIYNQRKLDVIRGNASIYVHGHSAGGTNPSLVEAMYLGLPVVAFDVVYNRKTTDDKAIYFKDSNDLQQILNHLTEEEVLQLSVKMKKLAEQKYVWKKITQKYKDLFQDSFIIKEKQRI